MTAKPKPSKLIPVLAVAGALAIPASASAHRTLCGHPEVPYVTVYATGVPCSTARAVERYFSHHEILTRTVRIAGRTWTLNVYRWPHGHVWVNGQRLPRWLSRLSSGKRVVDIYSPPYG